MQVYVSYRRTLPQRTEDFGQQYWDCYHQSDNFLKIKRGLLSQLKNFPSKNRRLWKTKHSLLSLTTQLYKNKIKTNLLSLLKIFSTGNRWLWKTMLDLLSLTWKLYRSKTGLLSLLKELFHKEQKTLDNNDGPVVLNQTALKEQDRQSFVLLDEEHTEPTSPRFPYSSTMNHVFRNSSRSSYTTHSYVEMVSKKTLDKLESKKWLEDNEEYVCFIVKGRNQENTTVKSIECAVPKAFKASQAAILSFCQKPLKKWNAIAIIAGSCNWLNTEVIKKINKMAESGRLFAIENNTVVAIKYICLTAKRTIGSMHLVNICPIKEGLIPPSDHLRISEYLQKTCNIPVAVTKKSNVKFVDTLAQCSAFIQPQENSDDISFVSHHQYIGFLIVVVMSIIGIFANSAAISVLANGGLEETKKSKSTTYFILMLSNGLLLLVSSLLMTLVALKIMSPFPFGWCHLVYIVRYCAFFGSTYCILLVTIERYIVICHPLKARLILTEFFQRTVRLIF